MSGLGFLKSGKPITLKFIFRLKLDQTTTQIKREIARCIYEYYTPKKNAMRTAIELELKALFEQKIKQSDTYKSLKGEGNKPLAGHFGFDDGGNKVDIIVNQWIEDIHIDIYMRRTIEKLSFGYKLYLVNRTFADVLALEAAYQDTGKSGTAGLLRAPSAYTQKLPWLRWLLLEGDKTIISNGEYAIHFEPGKGRSGLALMVKRKNASRWRIPPEHAGTLRNNWITRILKDLYPLVDGIVERAMTKYFNH